MKLLKCLMITLFSLSIVTSSQATGINIKVCEGTGNHCYTIWNPFGADLVMKYNAEVHDKIEVELEIL